MTKEELASQGWELVFSGPCIVVAWGKHMVSLHHVSGRKVSGYGLDEEAALNNVAEIIQKPLEPTREVSR